MNSNDKRTNLDSIALPLGPASKQCWPEAGTLQPALGSRNMQRSDIRQRMALVASGEGEAAPPGRDIAPAATPLRPSATQVERFHALYREQFDFVFRNLRRLGVASAQVDDALQDVFLVVLRKIEEFESGSHAKAWLFAIALRIARNYRRSERRRDSHVGTTDSDSFSAPGEHSPFERAARAQAARILHAFLDGIDEDKRSVFIMTELEQMTAPQIAAALSLNLNTVYARIRAARREFARAIVAERAGGDDGR